MKNNQLVISFLHSNYMINSYGTEKCVRELSGLLKENGYHHLCFFSFYHDYGDKAIGVNYDDRFEGIYEYNRIENVLMYYLETKRVDICAVHIHHLLNHKLDVLSDMINKYVAATYIFAHDFYTVCDSFKLIDSGGNFCGLSMPGESKCYDCNYKKAGVKRYEDINQFFENLGDNLKGIVCPSEFVKSGLVTVYPLYSDKIVLRPHLRVEGTYTRKPINGKIRIAYAGLQVADKGFGEWKQLVDEFNSCNEQEYEFFYLGTGREQLPNVKNIYVSTAVQGEDAMRKAVHDNDIDIVLMWTMCPETYSYVYYEMFVNGVFIVTNKKSGNVCSEVQKNGNGKMFGCFLDCMDFLKDVDYVKESVNRYRSDSTAFHPGSMKINNSLDVVIPKRANMVSTNGRKLQKNTSETAVQVKRPRKNLIKSIFYCLKHYKVINI